ncbi:MAG TPA: 4-amino-4-deoxy-L-arabinose transferase, partial [Bacillota bacterium]|nr:4-amino-4-deoxy-L-arabinose transferase [Bacillota bacterium]
PQHQKSLASLNTEYYFDLGKLQDWRNLSYLKKNRLTFGEYIYRNQIRYIIYPESLDWFYQNRPAFNYVYGNMTGYYEDLQSFLKNNCKKVGSFVEPIFGFEAARFPTSNSWEVIVYKVRSTE